jgi:hypothetical protein
MLAQEVVVPVAEVFERQELDHPPSSQLGREVVVVGRMHSDIESTATGQEEDLPNFGMHADRTQGQDFGRRRRAGRQCEVVG